MSPKAATMRSSAKASLGKTLAIPLGSHNGCDISYLNQIQSQGALGWDEADRASIEARFWPKVKKTESCWLWIASKTGGHGMQHGQFTFSRKRQPQRHIYAHRMSWELAYGAVPDGLQVLHRCDVPTCVRPEHLFLGTQQDNLIDARQKGRLNERLPRTRTFTLAERLAIYHMPNRRGIVVELALRYRVSKACITIIRQGRFIGSPFNKVFVRVPHVNLPVLGEVS